MEKKKVSVVIPVYNVEKYLSQCLDSVLSQSLEEIEVIVVNDGSTDGSSNICRQYSKRDKRIRLIEKENGGLSSALNVGIDLASGKYIIFLDSDDFWLDSNILHKMYNGVYSNNKNEQYYNRYNYNFSFIKCTFILHLNPFCRNLNSTQVLFFSHYFVYHLNHLSILYFQFF